ncbi:hypothetical protein TIFTF001_005461 [Ficus carica]|uniref:Uncharacterized protein n=1 Tax=Ficus carica TaxID=3494 RepID=A0AA88CYN8_FICCA|nr:hypothetical protein TIFTF001_005461 [Ficus carica]
MPTAVASSVEHASCVLMMIIMAVAPIGAIAMPSPSPISPVLSSPSLFRQPVERQLAVGEREAPNHVPSKFIEDYGYWNPTPYFDRGNAAPIPHGHVVEESFRTENMASEGRS